jgi:hypothetical protein
MRLTCMRIIARIFAISCVLCLAVSQASAQGTFTNLGFESANVPVIPPGQFGGMVMVSNAVPGWTVYIGAAPQSAIYLNNISLGGALVAIFGPEWYTDQILDGSYTVSLQPSSAGPPVTTAIGQTGTIPLGSESMRFYAEGSTGLSVTFAGHSIPVQPLRTGTNYTVYGGDVSSYAGQTGELLFQGGGLLDKIVFSTQSIPEPSAGSLVALAAAVCFVWISRRRVARRTERGSGLCILAFRGTQGQVCQNMGGFSHDTLGKWNAVRG